MNYSIDYFIDTPELKSSNNTPVKINPNLGNFTYDFDENVLGEFGLFSTSFCFFILWGQGLTGVLNRNNIWIKKEITIPQGAIINLRDPLFETKFYEEEPLSSVIRNYNFFEKNGLNASYIVIRNLKGNFAVDPSSSVGFFARYDSSNNKLIEEPFSLRKLQELLVINSNKRMHINKKLNYYETDLEKLLADTSSDTGALFPGDCDFVLFDENYSCKYIVEFKKTTFKDNLPLEKQSITNHMDRDRNKFTRINILREYFSEINGATVPFVTVFYSVRETDKIKLELVGSDLTVLNESYAKLSPSIIDNQRKMISEIVSICK